MTMLRMLTACFMISAACAPAAAIVSVVLPASFAVVNDENGSKGTTIAIGNVTAGDTLSFTASGASFLQGDGLYGVNAAGVTTTGGLFGIGTGASLPDYSSGFTYGALIVTLNSSQARQVFATSAVHGLGQSSIPQTLTYVGTLGDLFGVEGLLRDATLNFKVDDTGYTDNFGSFRIEATTPVPEPATWAMMLIGFGGMGYILRRRTARSGVRYV